MQASTRVSLSPAWVLRSSPYSDTSLLLEVFSGEQGRLGLIARGARSAKSRYRALLQPFRPLLLSWTLRGELGLLTGAETAGPALNLVGETIFSGWYLNELLTRLLHRHEQQTEIFSHYSQALERLGNGDVEPALRRFEILLIRELGFGLQLNVELDAGSEYQLDGDHFVAAGAQARGQIPGRLLIALRDETEIEKADLPIARQLMRARLKPLLGDKPLRTSEIMRSLKRKREQP